MIQIRESKSRVRVCESRAHPVFNQLSGAITYDTNEYPVAFARWNFLLPLRKNSAVKLIASLKQNNSEGFIGAP